MKKPTLLLLAATVLTGCATIVNDPMIPLTSSFSNGSEGQCTFENKRGVFELDMPGTVMVRRSDDALKYNCETDSGKEVSGTIKSEIEGAKLGASVAFFDLGITDAITDKHRTYEGNIVIPVRRD
jgi:uncharacterized protein YceK